jgi:hypothetical protein
VYFIYLILRISFFHLTDFAFVVMQDAVFDVLVATPARLRRLMDTKRVFLSRLE